MSINEVRYLPECGSTNAYMKEHFEEFGPVGAVYTTNQTAGRGRLGRSWLDAPHKGLYYTAVIRTDLVQPATLPLFASLAVCDALRERYRIDCQIKWPNDLLLNGKKSSASCARSPPTATASWWASASIWPSRRATLMPPVCPTAPRWRCRAQRWIFPPTPHGWPRA